MKISEFQVRPKNPFLLIFLDNDEEEGGDGGAGGNDQGESVIDLVDAHRLKEINLDKKAWTAYIKGKEICKKLIKYLLEYVKKIKAKLEESGKKDRIPEF